MEGVSIYAETQFRPKQFKVWSLNTNQGVFQICNIQNDLGDTQVSSNSFLLLQDTCNNVNWSNALKKTKQKQKQS